MYRYCTITEEEECLLSGILSDVIEDGRVSSVGDHGGPMGWLTRDGRGKNNILTVKMKPAKSIIMVYRKQYDSMEYRV